MTRLTNNFSAQGTRTPKTNESEGLRPDCVISASPAPRAVNQLRMTCHLPRHRHRRVVRSLRLTSLLLPVADRLLDLLLHLRVVADRRQRRLGVLDRGVA